MSTRLLFARSSRDIDWWLVSAKHRIVIVDVGWFSREHFWRKRALREGAVEKKGVLLKGGRKGDPFRNTYILSFSLLLRTNKYAPPLASLPLLNLSLPGAVFHFSLSRPISTFSWFPRGFSQSTPLQSRHVYHCSMSQIINCHVPELRIVATRGSEKRGGPSDPGDVRAGAWPVSSSDPPTGQPELTSVRSRCFCHRGTGIRTQWFCAECGKGICIDSWKEWHTSQKFRDQMLSLLWIFSLWSTGRSPAPLSVPFVLHCRLLSPLARWTDFSFEKKNSCAEKRKSKRETDKKK